MGSQYIEGFMETDLDIDQLLRIQLQNNHYPPVHPDFIPAAKEAIEACSCGVGDYERMIELPNKKRLTALQVVDGLHLHQFCTRKEEI